MNYINKNRKTPVIPVFLYGEPGEIRTPDPRLRRPMLYPTELLTHLLTAVNILPSFFDIVNKKRKKYTTN